MVGSWYCLGGCCCSSHGTQFSVILLSKELSLFGRQPEKEIKQEQSLNQPREESLEGIAKELETELEQEKMHLLQAKKEKIEQFREELRQQEDEEAEKLHQQKEKSLRYFPFYFFIPSPPCSSSEPFPAAISLLVATDLCCYRPPAWNWCCSAELWVKKTRTRLLERRRCLAQAILCMRICTS